MKKKHRSRSLKKLQLAEILLFSIALTTFFIIFNSASKYSKYIDLEQLPLIKKTNLDFKIQPKDADGLIIRHQNKTIYENLKSKSNDEHQKSKISLEINENLLIILRTLYLENVQQTKSVEDPFSVIEDTTTEFIINFGTTSNQEAAETKLHRLASTYQELAKSKFKILQTDKDKYRLETLTSIDKKNATAICRKIKLTGDECYVLRLPKN